MSRSLTVATLVGSLRAGSFNRVVARTAAELVVDRVRFVDIPLREVPFYDGDVEKAGDPPEVVALKDGVAAADGVIFFTPEYNRSVPAVTKNAVDWLSRPFLEGPLAAKPVGIVAAGPGRHDAGGVRDHLAIAAASGGGDVHDPSLGLPSISRAIEDGRVTGEDTVAALREWLAGFVAHVEAARDATGSA